MIVPRLLLFVDPEPRVGALNMALDEALLQKASLPILRVYRWRNRAVSFGYFGRIEEMERDWDGWELVRRWTGGGIVPHAEDFTYTLVVPKAEPFARESAPASYRAIHACVAEALAGRVGQTAALADEAAPKVSNACFQNPAQHDVLLGSEKVAGAAQRRTQSGLLHQGSIQLAGLDEAFGRALAGKFAGTVEEISPDEATFQEAERLASVKYGTAEWLRRF